MEEAKHLSAAECWADALLETMTKLKALQAVVKGEQFLKSTKVADAEDARDARPVPVQSLSTRPHAKGRQIYRAEAALSHVMGPVQEKASSGVAKFELGTISLAYVDYEPTSRCANALNFQEAAGLGHASSCRKAGPQLVGFAMDEASDLAAAVEAVRLNGGTGALNSALVMRLGQNGRHVQLDKEETAG
ncbi:hypothetical protein Emag_000518 [Eimeria magna]